MSKLTRRRLLQTGLAAGSMLAAKGLSNHAATANPTPPARAHYHRQQN